ncbi:MAG: DUF2281 domain-containing protein [Cyanobacteria bacterium P01_F01_bin.86]
MIQPAIPEKLEALPESLQTEVLHYIEFLFERYSEKTDESDLQKKKRSGFGIWQGKVWMADDFDAPLEDMKDYM